MLQDKLAFGLIAVATLSSALVLLTGSFVLFACGVALPLTTAFATLQ